MAALGRALATRTARVQATVLDVAPTILHALGVPMSRDLDGRVLTDCSMPETLADAIRCATSTTYGLRGAFQPRAATRRSIRR